MVAEVNHSLVDGSWCEFYVMGSNWDCYQRPAAVAAEPYLRWGGKVKLDTCFYWRSVRFRVN